MEIFESGVEPANFAQAGGEILVSPQLINCVDEWIPQSRRKVVHVEAEAIRTFPVFDTGILSKSKCTAPLIRGRN